MNRCIASRRARRPRPRQRRAVSSVLSMMFLVIFGSLAAAMAVVAQGNLRTADSSLKVSRAMSAAETGIAFAARRLAIESQRFVTTRGVIDTAYGEALWLGTYASDEVDVLSPTGYIENTPPDGLVEAVRNAHLADDHDFIAEAGDSSLPSIDTQTGTLLVRPIMILPTSVEENPPYFRLKYELLADEPTIRVTSRGVDGDVARTLQMDFRIDKKIEFAVISPNRIMIGKNVRVEGPLGSRYGIVAGELDNANGDPLVMRSDFYYLTAALDADLDVFYAQLVLHDADGDGRIRPDHPAESVAVDDAPAVMIDHDGNEYVDDFDLFLGHFDANSDGMVVYDSALAGGLSDEFDEDEQLARLIDEAMPDRDGDGIITASDTSLGYRNGAIDANDLYAKVRGRLAFAVARADWEAAHGDSYQTIVNGPIRMEPDVAPASFEVDTAEMNEITTDMLDDSSSWFKAHALTGSDFGDTGSGQVAAGIAAGGTYTAPDATTWESVPFGSQGAYDYYQRAVYEDMTFSNAVIPAGTNALFVNCTFVGVTYIETETDCDHENWNYAGSLEPREDPPGSDNWVYEARFPDLVAEANGTPVADTRLVSNNIRFHGCTFLGSVAGDKPSEYTHWRNKVQMTGATRFYIDPDDEDLAEQPDAATLVSLIEGMDEDDRAEMEKSSILLPGWSVDVGNFENEQAADPDDTPKVKLKGTIVAGILDARGTVDIHGTLLMTFRPVEGEGPLYYGGQPDAFNTTIGYFGPADGDGEGIDPSDPDFPGFGEITLRYDPDAKLPDGIPWPIRVDALPATYVEGGSY